MSGPKRPADPANSTLIMGPGEEMPRDEADESVEVDVDEGAGATAFLKPAAGRKPAAKAAAPQSPGSTVAMRAPGPPAEDDVPGGTAFVRIDGASGQQRSRKEQAPLAPRKG